MTNKIYCDAILFDLDGVLIDSTACVERHWRAWAEKHELDAEAVIASAHGVRSVEIIQMFAPHLDAHEESAKYEAIEVEDTAGVVPMKGSGRFWKRSRANFGDCDLMQQGSGISTPEKSRIAGPTKLNYRR